MRTTVNGLVVPEAGDDLLEAWPATAMTIGHIQQAGSIAAARAMLDAAQTAGHPPTPAHPFYYDIGGSGVVYRADGTRTGAGAWVLVPLGQSECVQSSSTISGYQTLTSGQSLKVASASLPVRPYDRRVTVTWTLFASVKAGIADSYARCGGDEIYARLGTDAWGTSVTTTMQTIVRAGTQPVAEAGVVNPRGGPGNASVGPNSSAAYSRLVLSADPITMA